MVEKLEKWRKVKQRCKHIQVDKLGYDFYLITLFDEGLQYVCDFDHILMIGKVLIELNSK